MIYKTYSNEFFLPVFSVDDSRMLKKLDNLEGRYGILAPVCAYDKILMKIREKNRLFFIDSGIFKNRDDPWYQRLHCEFRNNQWVREYHFANQGYLRQKVREYFNRCNRFSPDYVFAPDIFHEPLLSLYLARISWEEYCRTPKSYDLIGVVQVGTVLYNWQTQPIPQADAVLPYYKSQKSFLVSLISAYREIGYQRIALGGLLQQNKTMRTGLKFGLSSEELDQLLCWSRPQFVLGGLALSRIEVLRKYKVWSDSTNWLWWNGRYDYQRFGNRNILQEILA